MAKAYDTGEGTADTTVSPEIFEPNQEDWTLPPDVGVLPGFVLAQEDAEALVGRPIITRAFDWVPQGNRLLVVSDETPEAIGKIILTDNQRDLEMVGAGTIIAVGPSAGTEIYPGPAGCMLTSDPRLLLGLHVLYGHFAGKSMLFTPYAKDYDTEILMLTPFDILAVDSAENPQTADEEFEKIYQASKQGREDEAQIIIDNQRQAFADEMNSDAADSETQ